MTSMRSSVVLTALVFALLPFSAVTVQAQITFVEPLLTPLVATVNGHGAIGLAKGDFNADGKLDLAATFHDAVLFPPRGQVVVMLGNGDGTFQAPTTLFTLPENVYARGILARDFDGDGKLDIVVDVYELHEVLFFKGHGDGTFDAPIASATNFGPAGVQTADLNGDGILDLVTVDPGDNRVSVLLGNGDGTFGPATDYSVPTRPWDVAIGDVNGDGAHDLVVGIFGTTVISVLLNKNDGTGGFLSRTDMSAGMNVRGLYLADFDGDGKLDVVVAGQDCESGGTVRGGQGCMAFMKGSGTGTFSTPSSANFIGVSERSSRQYSENVAPDINGDGKPDVVFAHEEDGNTISIGLGNGDGTFTMSFWVGWPGSGQGAQPSTSYFPDNVNGFDALAGDFNGDGVMDFAVPTVGGDQARGGVSIMLGKTPGTFQAPRIYQALGGDFRGGGLAFGDFTSDGHADLAVLAGFHCPPDNLLDVFPGHGDGSLGDSMPATPAPGCGGGNQRLRSVDLDNDGKLDLVFLGFDNGLGQNQIVVASGNGNGTFTLFSSFTLAVGGINLVLGDFNGDGFPDVAVFEPGSCAPDRADIEVFLQGAGGTKTFTSKSILPVVGDCLPNLVGAGAGIVAADFDQDGNVDLVVSTVNSGVYSAVFFKGNGDGTFQGPTVIGPGISIGRDGITDYAAADVNGDGKPDLIGSGDGGVWVQLGNGDGTFEAPVQYAPSSGGIALKVADFDGDGNLDIAVIGGNGTEFSVLPGNGDGTFGAPRKFAVGSRNVQSLDVADLDGGGHPSVVVKQVAGSGSGSSNNNIVYTVLINNTPPPADLAISKTDSPDPVTVGSNLTYTITVTNNGPGAATGVTVTDPLPKTVTFVSATPSQGACTGTSTVSCGLGSLANGGSATVTIVVTATKTAVLSNTAIVAANERDPDPSNNSATQRTTVNPQLTALSPAKVWVSNGSSNSLGIKFDLRAEVYVNATLVGSGHVNSVASGFGTGFFWAKLISIPLALVNGPVQVPAGSVLKIRVLARNACVGSSRPSGAARVWFNGKAVDSGFRHDAGSRFDATIGGVTSNYFLRGGFVLAPTAGTSRQSVNAAVGSPCGPFVPFGTWSITR